MEIEKIRPFETVSQMGRGRIQENGGGIDLKYVIFDILIVRSFANGTMYPHPAKQ
jgi:hypothetical protein